MRMKESKNQNIKMDILIYENLEELNASFTEWMKNLLEENGRLTISLSGGSTPKSLFDYWSENHANDIDWDSTFFFWGDERCVPPADDQSNYKMTKDHLLSHVPIPEKNIFRIKGENDPEKEAERYSNLLEVEVDMENNIPAFDIVILGMGDDGHTASIFPHEMELWNSEEYCVVGTHPDSGQKRVSLSGTTINNARNIAFLVTGAGKAEKVKEIVGGGENVEDKYPAAKVDPVSGNLFWFLDQAAAKLLVV